MKVLLSTPTNTFTGYGVDGCALVRVFRQWGADVYLAPSAVHPPLPRDVAEVLTKPLPTQVDLALAHRCPQELARSDTAGMYSAATVSLAWSMWEFDDLSMVDVIDQNNCEHSFRVCAHLPQALQSFDGVLAYDEVSKTALSPYHDNTRILQGGVTPMEYVERDWFGSPFRFVMAGMLGPRKNVFAAIHAFKQLREAGELADAELHLKTVGPGLPPALEEWCPGLRIHSQAWSRPRLEQFYATAQALLTTSWGEGKNIPAAEFAASGGAVALPIVGGHAQWANPEYIFPLRYSWEPYCGNARGAKVDMESLKETMLEMYSDRGRSRNKAEIAARVLPSLLSWERVLERLQFQLPDLAGRRGQEVAALMAACRRAPTDRPQDRLAQAVGSGV